MQNDEGFEEMFLWSMNDNLNWNVRFYNETRRLMHNEIVTINLELDDCKDNDERGNLKFRKHYLINSFFCYALNNSFLMQWSLIEEMLYLIHKFKYSNTSIPKKTSFRNIDPCLRLHSAILSLMPLGSSLFLPKK